MELGPEDVSLLERCPHFRGCCVHVSVLEGFFVTCIMYFHQHIRVPLNIRPSRDLKPCSPPQTDLLKLPPYQAVVVPGDAQTLVGGTCQNPIGTARVQIGQMYTVCVDLI